MLHDSGEVSGITATNSYSVTSTMVIPFCRRVVGDLSPHESRNHHAKGTRITRSGTAIPKEFVEVLS